jgi:hypothetical protein
MVVHEDVTNQLPSAPADSVLQARDEPSSIRVVADDFLSGVAPRHDMVDGTLELDPKSSWHDQSLRAADWGVK